MSGFKANMHENRFTAFPTAPSWNEGDLLLREGDDAARGREGKK